MPNERGWYSKEEAYATGLPIWIRRDSMQPGQWTHKPYDLAVLLTRTRCKELGMPTLRNGMEAPSAFRYKNSEGSQYRYIPLYDRTDVFESGELPFTILNEWEIMKCEEQDGGPGNDNGQL